jgi:hypothetical protein
MQICVIRNPNWLPGRVFNLLPQEIGEEMGNNNSNGKKMSSVEFTTLTKSQQTMIRLLGSEVSALIDNKKYLPRYRALQIANPGELVQLVEIAQTKVQPSHWFAKACSKANWPMTLKMLRKVSSVAYEVRKRVGELSADFGEFITQRLATLPMAGIVRVLEHAAKARAPERYIYKCLVCKPSSG